MYVSVFGLGYVGTVTAACLARDGNRVIGVDLNPSKVEAVRSGMSPILEPGLGDLIGEAVVTGRLTVTQDEHAAVRDSAISLVCVGTPSAPDGSLDLSHVREVCRQIGSAIASKEGFHIVAVRSTVLPGTLRSVVVPTLESASGKRVGVDFGVCNNPEFLREGTAVYDYDHPSRTVIGDMDGRSARILAKLYAALEAPLIITDVETAELVKYADNAWHAIKVCFANEIGTLCKATRVDCQKVMDIFVQDTKLNLSPSYLRAGFAFGGSCLPKDVRALVSRGRSHSLDLPLLCNILTSNQRHLERGIDLIKAQGEKRVGLLGMTFKAHTDDLRESPMVHVAQALLVDGLELRIYDRNVRPSQLTGANREYLLRFIPQIETMLTEKLQEVLDFSPVLVIGRDTREFADLMRDLPTRYKVVDLVRISLESMRPNYVGICW